MDQTNIRQVFVSILHLLVFVQIPALAKYIIIEPEKSIYSQMKYDNCTYEIRDEISLEGKILNIPASSSLFFRGGSLKGGSICFDNTYLDGDVRIAFEENATIKGNIKNETIYTRWFQIEDMQLFLLLNSLIPDNKHKGYIIKTGEYRVRTPLILRDLSDVSLDFNGSTLIDETQGESVLLHRPNPMILIRKSHNVEIRNMNYEVSANRYFSKTGTAIIWMGAASNDWDKDCYNIRISNITGKGNLVKSIKGGISSNMLISGVGNVHNITVENIEYDGDLASICNFEWGLLPAESKVYQQRGINLPSYYGIHPYNVIVSNVVGRNAPNSTGYIRLSSCYNVTVDNCYGYNVNCLLMLYNGDMSISRVSGGAVVRNCTSYINKDYKGSSLSGIIILNTFEDPVSKKKHSMKLDHNVSYTIENCEFLGYEGIPGNGIRVLGGDGHVVLTNVTVKNYGMAAKLSGTTDKKKVGGLTFSNCLFLNNQSSVEIYSLDDCTFQGCTFRSNVSHTSRIIGNSQVAIYSGVENFTLRNCIFEDESVSNKAAFVTFEQKENVNATIESCRFMGSKAEGIPVVAPKSVSLTKCFIN